MPILSFVVDRFVHIVRCPHNPAALDKRRYVAAVVVGVWLTMILANSPLLTLYRIKAITSPFHEPYYYCALDSHKVCPTSLLPCRPTVTAGQMRYTF